MSRRRLSRFSPIGAGGFGDLPPLTPSQRAHLLYAASPANLPAEAYSLAENVRQSFYAARIASRDGIPHRLMQRELEEIHRGLAAVASVLGGDGLASTVVVRQLATRTGKRPGHILAQLRLIEELERAAAEAVEVHSRRSLPDQRTPFYGLACELLWIWRGVLGLEPAISNRPPVSAFSRFAFALMGTVPRELQMHVAGVDPSDPDTWGAFTKALQRADRATREFQVQWPMARLVAWSLGDARGGS